MNVTFLIGNGFDRNLGLKTSYSDFVRAYKKTEPTTDTLRDFRNYINQNEELWSKAEEEMGRYTAKFEDGDGAAFYQCHRDFCEKLADYLKNETKRIDYQFVSQEIEKAFSRMKDLSESFPTKERDILKEIYNGRKSENIVYNFVVYNYTDTLDKCISVINKKQDVLGRHTHGTINFNHAVRDICHVHGTVESKMVFGVNDESQIAKTKIFDCEYGDLYQEVLIKKQANEGYQEDTDNTAKTIIANSHIIYIYGMSIGITDTLWWERICAWLSANGSRHLIVYRHNMPTRGLLEVDYKIEERKAKQEISSYLKKDDSQKREIEKRIHITGENIFSELKDIATKRERNEKTLEALYREARKNENLLQVDSLEKIIDYIEDHEVKLPTEIVV